MRNGTKITAGALVALGLVAPRAAAERTALAIVADTNRDGVVAFESDLDGRAAWSNARGAILLNNCDDDDGDGEPDNANDLVDGNADCGDFAFVSTRAPEGLADESRILLSVDAASADRVRIFATREESGARVPFGPPVTFENGTAAIAPNSGFAIEAKQFADAEWDGMVTLTLALERADIVEASDRVQMKVAPWIMLANDKAGRVVYAREFPGRNDAFMASLREYVPRAGAELFAIPGGAPYGSHEVWLQDTMEIGYTEMPGARMPVVLQANRGKSIDDFSKASLLGADFGWYRVGDYRPAFGEGDGGTSWIDWFGNLEIAPPTSAWPLGRMYYGTAGDDGEAQLDPRIVAMIRAQGVQAPPLAMDVGWLLIKHVDEMVCFVPTGIADDPYRVLVPSVTAMIELAEGWVEAGQGDVPLLSIYEKGMTTASLLADGELRAYNEELQRDRIDANNAVIVAELGVGEDALVHVPAYYKRDGRSMVPNMVNSLVVNDTLFLPTPNGPVVEGADLLEAHVLELLSTLPQKKVFLDDRLYHEWCGNVHCATNTLRDPGPAKWWDAD